MLVPVLLVVLIASKSFCGMPSANSWRWSFPSLFIFKTNFLDNALTTETPTPWSPPDTLYVSLSNLPPAWSTVKTTVAAEIFSVGWISTGIPLPLSVIMAEPSFVSSISIVSQYPAIDSSMELSTTS